MKKIMILLALMSAFANTRAQEIAPAEEARKAAQLVTENMGDNKDATLKIDLDIEKPQVLKASGVGFLVVPAKEFSAKSLEKISKEVTPIGSLWMLKVVPSINGKSPTSDKLRRISVSNKDKTFDLTYYQLGARKNDKDALELVVYSKDKQPLLTATLDKKEGSQDLPIELAGHKQDEGSGVLTLNIAGKYKADVTVVPDE